MRITFTMLIGRRFTGQGCESFHLTLVGIIFSPGWLLKEYREGSLPRSEDMPAIWPPWRIMSEFRWQTSSKPLTEYNFYYYHFTTVCSLKCCFYRVFSSPAKGVVVLKPARVQIPASPLKRPRIIPDMGFSYKVMHNMLYMSLKRLQNIEGRKLSWKILYSPEKYSHITTAVTTICLTES